MKALALFSGGLDSILACRLVMQQGLALTALKFVTPFFDHDLTDPAHARGYCQSMLCKYGLEVEIVDLSVDYLRMLEKPSHGFGRNFNPCIDCKILMLRRARQLMDEHKAAFLVTGEVLGQRPMSQRRDTLCVIERDSGCQGILLRPLSAKLLPPTLAEEQGIIDREQLLAVSGRGRKEQIALAGQFGIQDYPNPAGGCLLTDPNLAHRIKNLYQGFFTFPNHQICVDDIRLLTVGRQFRLSKQLWFVLGRDERENKRLQHLRGEEDWLLRLRDLPGPLGLLRYGQRIATNLDKEQYDTLLRQLSALIVRYAKKNPEEAAGLPVLIDQGQDSAIAYGKTIPEQQIDAWRIR